MSDKENIRYSEKNGLVTFILCIFLGIFGVHRFYTKKIGTGILMLLLCWTGISVIWWIIDTIMILLGKFKDKNGAVVSFGKSGGTPGVTAETDMEKWFADKNQKYMYKLAGKVPGGIGSRTDLYVTEKEVILRHTPYALMVPFEIIRNFKISSVAGVTVNTQKGTGFLSMTIPGCAEADTLYGDPQLKTDKRTIFFDESTGLQIANDIKNYIDNYK
jgi:TM2 domain-containing membrane protein YozV